MKYNSASDIEQQGFDYIIEEPAKQVNDTNSVLPACVSEQRTYLFRLDLERSTIHDCMNKPAWQIRMISEKTFADGKHTTVVKYPNGSNAYVFVANDYESYVYEFLFN